MHPCPSLTCIRKCWIYIFLSQSNQQDELSFAIFSLTGNISTFTKSKNRQVLILDPTPKILNWTKIFYVIFNSLKQYTVLILKCI
jgi:hypothetical protein